MSSYRILILMSHTGGGHHTSALALQQGFASCFEARIQMAVVDFLADCLPGPLALLPKTYPYLTHYVPQLWQSLYTLTSSPALSYPVTALAGWAVRRSLCHVVQEFNPDLVISVHPLAQDISLSCLRHIGCDVPLVTVVTDLVTAHPLWFHHETTLCIVASAEARRRALREGLSPARVCQIGLPVRPEFDGVRLDRRELRRRLGMECSLPAVMLIGGGDGQGPLFDIACQISSRFGKQSLPVGQLVVVCGHNRRLRRRMETYPWAIPTRIQGYVHNLHEWMMACDCLVTKAGPGTISEALVCGLPMILSGYIPGQEEGNVAHVLTHGAGIYSPEPAEIADVLYHWLLCDEEDLLRMAERARCLARPDATRRIVEEISRLLT